MRSLAAVLVILVAFSLTYAADRGSLLVRATGKLLLIQPDGTQRLLADVDSGMLSPDGRYIAFTTAARPKTLFIAPVGSRTSRAATDIVTLPDDAHFERIGWAPDGNAVAYEVIGTSDDLFLAPFPPARGKPRNLGHWYQGFSFSPDGSKIVHAVNAVSSLGQVTSGLEVLDIRSGQRTLLHKTKNIVWDARYSPDGHFIAYQMTTHEPVRSDDEPSCEGPTIGLWIYSLANHTDRQVTFASAPAKWDNVKTFNWSPDGKRIALTLGTTDCDYPGSEDGVFLTTPDLGVQNQISSSTLSFEPVFSPDGSAVAFLALSGPAAGLLRYDLTTGELTLIRRATQEDDYYRLLDWR